MGHAGNLAWDTAFLKNQLTRPEDLLTFNAVPVEQLFDLREDPFNIRDLAKEPDHAKERDKLSQRMDGFIRDSKDLGFFPRDARIRGTEDLYSWVRGTDYPLERLQAQRFAQPSRNRKMLPRLLPTSRMPSARFVIGEPAASRNSLFAVK